MKNVTDKYYLRFLKKLAEMSHSYINFSYYIKIFVIIVLSLMSVMPVQSKQTQRADDHLEFQPTVLSPVFFHSNQKLVDFIYSALLVAGEAAGKDIGNQGSPANIFFFIKNNAIKNEKLNFEVFPELPNDDVEYLKRIRFSNDLCALEIPNSQLSLLVLDPSKIGADKNAKICAIYALSIILGANLPRPNKFTIWENIMVGMLNKFASQSGEK